jgi:D-amino-acid dehydrogenase
VRVIVIGGGAVGLCTAEALSSRGCEVTVLERDRCGAGASAGNAGWVTPSLATPVPGPGVIAASLRWLIDPSGPLWIRPSLDPAMLGWIARFLANCRRPVYERGLAALQQAARLAPPAFDALTARGVEFEEHKEPLLFPAFERGELEHLMRLADELHRAGSRQQLEPLSAQELKSLEPALGEGVLGGVIAHGERRVRPESLTAELLEPHGVRLPIAAAKGYSRTYERTDGGPRRALYLENPKVAISVFDEGVRVSGTLELGARDLALSPRRLGAITTAASRALPGWRMPAQPRDWAGMRSLSPDGLPYIGPVPSLEGVHIATAHGTLGITLAPLTGELLAGMLLDGARNELLSAFDPARVT